MNPEPLPEAVRAALERTAPFGAEVHAFQETTSTNDVAAALAARGAPEGTIVIAGTQTAGRGRLGRSWHSPADAGLYVSLVCRNRAAAPLLTLAGGVAVAEGVRAATGLPVEIKWPNDIVMPSGTVSRRWRKLAGVLAEASSAPDGFQHVVLGFGINLRAASYPPELADRATSIETELGRAVEAGPVLVEVLAAFAGCFRDLAAGRRERVLNRWRALAPFTAGSRITWESDEGARAGTTIGIDDDGALLVRSGGDIIRVISGEITWRP